MNPTIPSTVSRVRASKGTVRPIWLFKSHPLEVLVASFHTVSGNVDAGIRLVEEMGRHHHGPTTHRLHLGLSYVQAGRRDDARRIAEVPLEAPTESEQFDHALLSALVGRPDAARKVAQDVERGAVRSYTSAAHLAMLYSAIGERERALDLLEQDCREGDATLWLYYRHVCFDPVRDDPRFRALLEALRLPTSPRAPGRNAPAADRDRPPARSSR